MREKPGGEDVLIMSGAAGRACTDNDIKERLAFYVEWYVLDDDGGGYNLVVLTGCAWGDGRGENVAHGGRASRGREVGIIVGGEGAVVWLDGRAIVEPLLG